jgi:hypothetical protein
MTEIDRLTKIRDLLAEARRYVGKDVFPTMITEPILQLIESDSSCAGSLYEPLSRAIMMWQADPDATRGAIDYTRGWLAWTIGRLERDERKHDNEAINVRR